MVTAVVKDDAASAGVPSFTFTSGHHPDARISLPFWIAPRSGQAPRTLKIRAVGPGWVLEKAGGDVRVDQP